MSVSLNPVSKTPKTSYQFHRDALIPAAKHHADTVAERKTEGTEWTLAFFAEMDRLAREHGIVKHSEDGYRREAERREAEAEAERRWAKDGY